MLEELWNASNRPLAVSGQIFGLVLGTVKENWDEENKGRVKVEYQLGEKGRMVSSWAPVASPYTASDCGMYFLPEVGNTVLILFEGGNTSKPVVIGSLWGSSTPMPAKVPQEKNPVKVIKTKGGTEIAISDEEGKESLSLTTKGGLTISLSEEKKTVTIQDSEGENSVLLNGEEGKLTLNAKKELILSVGGTAVVTVESNKAAVKSGTVSLEGSQKLELKGQTMDIKGSQIQMKADASAKVESGGITEVKGNMVKIN